MIHDLKTWPQFWYAVERGEKTFEIRNGDDRVYQRGDLLRLRMWDPEAMDYVPGYVLTVEVTYVSHGPPFLPPGLWVLAIKRIA